MQMGSKYLGGFHKNKTRGPESLSEREGTHEQLRHRSLLEWDALAWSPLNVTGKLGQEVCFAEARPPEGHP